ncbi:MAG: hypothetical protein GU348_03890 [Thermogladius sp.]|jgi:hypothetical protein|nr:hypothetical protein [Thermogladius sp.]
MRLIITYGRDDESLMIKSIVEFAVGIAREKYGVPIEVYEVRLEGIKGVRVELEGNGEVHLEEAPSLNDLVEALVVAGSLLKPSTPYIGGETLATG